MRFVGILIFSLYFLSVHGQCPTGRYYSHQFNVDVITDVVYANSPELTPVYLSEAATINVDLKLDIYFPAGDTLIKRPLVILAYGGGYLFGTKEDEDVSSTCDSLAKKGYVAVSIDYRMNLSLVDANSSTRAMYRGAQDWSAAVRFMKENAEVYGIDTNDIFIGGVSAGGISANTMIYIEENERPVSTFQYGILGENPDLGCIDCVGNDLSHSNEVRGMINLWGAIPDTTWMDANEIVPTVMFHGTNDLIVPYGNDAPFSAQFLADEVYGSLYMHERLVNLGGQSQLNTYAGEGHNLWGVNVLNVLTPGPTELWNPISDSIVSFLWDQVRPEPISINALDQICLGEALTANAISNSSLNSYCWEIDGANIISQSNSNVEVSFDSAGVYTLSVVGYDEHLAETSTTWLIEVLPTQDLTIVESNTDSLIASPGFSQYQWYLDGNPISNATSQMIVATASGNYTVTGIGNNGCVSTSNEIFVLISGLSEYNITDNISYYRFFDLQGREVLPKEKGLSSALLLKVGFSKKGVAVSREYQDQR